MSWVPLLSPSSESVGRGRAPSGSRPLTSPALAEVGARPKSVTLVPDAGDVPAGRPAIALGDQIDAAISDIYGAWLLIHTRCQGAGVALVAELSAVTDELDGAIRHLQAAALESHARPNWQYRPVITGKRQR